MPNPEVPGIRRVKIDRASHRAGRPERFYFAVNLDELTEEVAFGRPGHDKDSGTPRAFWSDEDLARCLFGPKDLLFTSVEAKAEAILLLGHLVAGTKMNDAAIQHARKGQGFTSRRQDAKGNPRGPTILYFPEDEVRDLRLPDKHRELVAERLHKIVPGGDKSVLEHLSQFTKDNILRVEAANKALRKQTRPVAAALGKIQNAHMAITAMIDFAKSPAERKALWATDEPITRNKLVSQEQLVPEMPKAGQIQHAELVRSQTLPRIAKPLGALMSWLTSGLPYQGPDGKSFPRSAKAKFRNDVARLLLDELRGDAVILSLLEHYDLLTWGVRLMLDLLLSRAFRQMASAPDVAADLAASEFMTIARLATARDLDIKSKGSTERENALAGRLAFVPAVELREVPTPLTKKLEAMLTVKGKAVGHGDTLGRLLAAAMPTMVYKVAEAAEASGGDGELTVRAWLFSTVIGVADVDNSAAQKLFDEVSKAATLPATASEKARHKAISNLFELRKGPLAGAHVQVASSVGQNALKSVLAIFALTETMRAKDKPHELHDVKVLKAFIEASQAGFEFGVALAKAPQAFRAAGGQGGDLLAKLDKLTEHGLYKGVGHFASFLGFISTVFTAIHSVPTSRTDGEKQAEAVVMSALDLTVGIAATFVPGGLPVATLVLFVSQAIVFNRDLWAFMLDLDTLAPTGEYVRGVWRELRHTDKALKGLVGFGPPDLRKQFGTHLDDLDKLTPEAFDTGMSPFWRLGATDLFMPTFVVDVLQKQYGFDRATARSLAGL